MIVVIRGILVLMCFFIYQAYRGEPAKQFVTLFSFAMVGLVIEYGKRQSDQYDRDEMANHISRGLNPDGNSSELSPEDQQIEEELEQWISDDPPPMPVMERPRPMSEAEKLSGLPVALYLRPFAIDGRIMVPNPEVSRLAYRTIFFYKMMVTGDINIEELLTHGVHGVAHLVAIGKQTDILGAGKISASDTEWREEFVRLATAAEVIISVPALYESTLWELKWLSERGMFAKTIMLFTDMHHKVHEKYDLEHLQAKLAEYGWILPEDISLSSAVAFDSNGRWRKHESNTRFRKASITKIVQEVLEEGTSVLR